jgi:hypothetical protein
MYFKFHQCTVCEVSSCSKETQTSLTYVIVSQNTATRTCIHSPLSVELSPITELPSASKINLEHLPIVHFDSRHTAAAIAFARRASSAGCIVTLDLEKTRPGILDLITECDVIFTNKEYLDQICSVRYAF